MATINSIKDLAAADSPVLFFVCTVPGVTSTTYYWSSHSLMFQQTRYEARVLRHNLFTLQLSADDAMEGMSQLSVVLGNADGVMSQVNGEFGFRGAQLSVYFAFVDLTTEEVTTESTLLFRGIAGDPEEVSEETITLTFTNKLSLQRVAIPDVRVQRSCPWNFPASASQRQEASDGGSFGRFSRFYRCGYSADIAGGVGNLKGGVAFTSCDKSRAQCIERGMFQTDDLNRPTSRYGGFEFVPTSYLVRGANDKASHLAAVIDNTAKYNDPVPMVYGTGWLKAPVIFSRNDGNLTHMEVLLGLGPIQGVLKVVINDVEIPLSGAGSNMTATGWYSLISIGDRVGTFNLAFADSSGPQGDPHGSMAALSVVVPNAISPGTTTPTVQVLMQGIQVDSYNENGVKSGAGFSNNPAWIILDVLQRAGWSIADLDTATFQKASQVCEYLLDVPDLNGHLIQKPRYGCNLVISKRQSAAAVVRGIRVASSMMLRYGMDGLLELMPEGTLTSQQGSQPDGTNSRETLNGGYPAYEFSDSSAGFSGIARNSHGGSSLVLTSRSISETSNRLSVEFQDEDNEYQQDSLSVANSDDSDLIGFEVASQSTALGLPNYSQATRILLRQLDKSTDGNQYVEFQTSFRALKVRPGDIIAISYEREGFSRAPFRVLKISPSLNYELVTILAQVHHDYWYSDDVSVLQSSGRQPNSLLAIPRPLLGTVAHSTPAAGFEYFDLALSDTVTALRDGSAIDSVTIGFVVPGRPSANSTYLPIVDLSPLIETTGGALAGGSTWYYAVTAVDTAGAESGLSFNIPVNLPSGSSTNSVTLQNLSFPKTAATLNVYRGRSPQMLYQIASGQPITSGGLEKPKFKDAGLPPLPIGPPDASFNHANFYYRYEYGGPYLTSESSAYTITCLDMGAVNGAYAHMVVLITEGSGSGQERTIVSNTQTELTLLSAWSILPDSSSSFVISEAAWKLAAISSHASAQFDIPYRIGGVIQVTGRAANILNQESSPDLAPIAHMAMGLSSNTDAGVPSIPLCYLQAPGAGDLSIFNVGFQAPSNIDTVTSGTLQLFYWDETNNPGSFTLAQGVDESGTVISVLPANSFYSGQFLQIEDEIMSVVSQNGATTTVFRGAERTTTSLHAAGSLVFPLQSHTVVLPFAPGFFENRASSNYIHTVNIPDIMVYATEFFVTNAFGNSQAQVTAYTPLQAPRTLSGGQYALQVNGYLATQQNAAPPLVVQDTHAVRDVRITFNQPPAGYVITVELMQSASGISKSYCQLTYDPSQATPTNVVSGIHLPPLVKEALLTINLSLSLIANYTQALNPGRDLTVTIRM